MNMGPPIDSRPRRAPHEQGPVQPDSTAAEWGAGTSALIEATRKLEACAAGWGTAGHAARLDEALRYNLRLWTLFQCELSQPGRDMLPNLRRDLLRLGAFTDRCTFECMADPGPARLQTLIDIDRNIASGLNDSPPGTRA